MEMHIINKKGGQRQVVLLDENMRIIKPIFDYLEFLRVKEFAFNTLIANCRDLKHYWEFLNLKHYNYDSIKPIFISGFIEYLKYTAVKNSKIIDITQKKVRTPQTINRILSSVHGFYKFYEMKNGINNPMVTELVNRPTNMFKEMLYHIKRDTRIKQSIFKVKEKRSSFHLITDEEAKKVFDYVTNSRDLLIFKILFLTGARIGEVLELKITDIPYPDRSCSVGVLRNIQSKGKLRNLYIPTSLIEEIDNYIINERCPINTEHEYIFVCLKTPFTGKPLTYSSIYQIFGRIKKKNNLNFHLHSYRHTFVTHMIESGMDMSVVQLIVGHAHISTTEQYTHISNKYLEQSLGEYWKNSFLIGGGSNAKSN